MLLSLSLLFACSDNKEQSFDYTFQTDVNEDNPAENEEDATTESDENSSETVEETDETEEPETPDSEQEEDTDVAQEEPEDTPEESVDTGVCTAQNVGTSTGDCAENFSLTDINDLPVFLHDYYGQVIFLDLSSFT